MVMLEDPKVSWIRDRPCLYIYFEKTLGDAFELWCWRTLLRVPCTARRSNQSILKIIPGCSLEELMLKLKLQYFGHLMQRSDSLERSWCWKGLGAGGEGDDRGWDGWNHQLDGHEFESTPGVGDRQRGLTCWVHGVAKSWTWLSDWTEPNIFIISYLWYLKTLFKQQAYIPLANI